MHSITSKHDRQYITVRAIILNSCCHHNLPLVRRDAFFAYFYIPKNCGIAFLRVDVLVQCSKHLKLISCTCSGLAVHLKAKVVKKSTTYYE